MEELVVKPLHCRRLARSHLMRESLFRFQKYFGEPRRKDYKGRLVVIDALDECSDCEVQCDLLRIIASACDRLVLPFRFLIASRPEVHIERAFRGEGFERIRVKRINLGDDPDADRAIRRYLLQEFEKIRRGHRFGAGFRPTEDVITELVEQSSTQFIYPSTVIKYIQDPRGRPDKRLDVILGISSPRVRDLPFEQLDALYAHIFSSANDVYKGTVKCLFGILFLASRPEYEHLTPSLAFLESALELEGDEVVLLLDDFVSLVAVPEDRVRPIRLFHASLFDFLRDPERSGGICLDLSIAHEAVVMYFSRCLNKGGELFHSMYLCGEAIESCSDRCLQCFGFVAFTF